jgi:hypothetical protein
MPLDSTFSRIPHSQERRRYLRIRSVGDVHCEAAEQSFTLHVHNASFGGLFLKGAADRSVSLPEGAELELSIQPRDRPGVAAIRLRGRVVRMQPESTGESGIGIRITHLDAENATRYRSFIGMPS